MALRNLIIPRLEVSVDGEQSFSVTGITATQVFNLYIRHREQLKDLYDKLAGNNPDGSAILNSVEGIIVSFPVLVGETIAIASGSNPFDETPAYANEPDGLTNWQADLNAAMQLSLPVQVDALFKIGELTFSPDMPPKKFFGLLVAMIQQANLSGLTLGNGSGN